MNSFKTKLLSLDSNESLNIAQFSFKEQILTMMSLELPKIDETYSITLAVKPTNVAIAKEFSGVVSYSNNLKAKIIKLDMQKLLCNVILELEEVRLESIITTKSAKRLMLSVGDEVNLFIKASDLYIKEIHS